MRRARLGVMLLLWLVAVPATPAAASHDDYGPGTVILTDAPAGEGHVTVVFTLDTDEQEATGEVQAMADQAGVELHDVEALENTDPDTLRVMGRTNLGERTGFLTRRVPAEAISPWERLADDGKLYLHVNRWADVDQLGRATADGAYRITAVDDVSYRISGWALLAPLLALVGAALVPYLALRGYAAAAVRRGGPPEDQLHRIRRGAVIAQLLVPIALIAALFSTDSMDWLQLALGEVLPDVVLPTVLLSFVRVLGLLLPFLVAMMAMALAVVPYDRRLRSTQQTSRAGAGQVARLFVLMLAPVVLWFMVVSVLPDLRGWVLAPVALVFLLALVVVQPLILNSVMGTRPLDDDLRERVLALCRDHGLRVRDARMLDSRGGRVANAAISGILPQVRYVYLTDHLIEILDDDEMNAVVAHEIGHGRGHHLLLKLLTGLAVPAVIVAAGALGGTGILRWFADSMGMLGFVLGFPLVFLTVLLLVHGVVGIALEKRADDYAVREIGLEPLARALDKLADANMMKRRTGWLWNVLQQHPGMEQRIKRLKDRADVGAHA